MNCYVVNKLEPIFADNYHNASWYPERTYSLNEIYNFDKSLFLDVVTQNPFIVSCYKSENVFYTNEKGNWIHPKFQTYGCSIEIILDRLLDLKASIPNLVRKKLSKICKEPINTIEQIQNIKNKLHDFGDSIEKDLCLMKLNQQLRKFKTIVNEI